ncbi:hypothetical protein [Brevibacillus daliensis]|uniref:hypothetical protein n=1 Tax=Brevibacillus daliensis TaxID=2892995 RepID=UPI001E57BB1A|nr:hypothetical protein [Brevibacillus daliensis]
MNKKVVLSVLSTALVTSMATSAFAASTGFYLGGDVDKYYSGDALINKAAAAKFASELPALGKNQILFVDNQNRVATLQDMEAALDAGNTSSASAFKPATGAAFDAIGGEQGFFAVNPDGTAATDKVKVPEQDETPAGDLKVESVSAINAKKLEIKFSQEVDATEAKDVANYTIVGLGTNPVIANGYDLKDDNKTLVITLTNPIANGTTFVVTVDEIQSKADAEVKSPKFTKTISFSDTVKPALVDVKYPQSGVAVVNFTEELQPLAAGTVKVFADGSEVQTVNSQLTADGKGIELAGLAANKEYRVVILGAKDWSNNLVNPNPLEVTVKSTVVDAINPEVTSVKAVGFNKVEIKFSEPIKNQGTPQIPNYLTLNAVGVTVDAQAYDSKTNIVTLTVSGVNAAGVKAVTVSAYKDLAGNDGDSFTSNVVFGDIIPTVDKTEVVKDGTDTIVKLTFKNDVTLATSLTGDIIGKVTTPENVVKAVNYPVSGNLSLDGANAKVVKIKVLTPIVGKYEVSVPKAVFGPGLQEDLKLTFDIAKSVDSSVPAIKVDAGTGNDKVEITNKAVRVEYTIPMGQSALDVNNYTVSGKKVFDKAIFIEEENVVELTLNDKAIEFDGAYDLEISKNVKAKNGVALAKAYTYTGDFKENVAPTIAKAQFNGASEIVLTFSENIVTNDVVAGIEVLVDGTKASLAPIAEIDVATNTIKLVTTTGDDFVSADEFESAVVVVNIKKDNNITDVNTNELKAIVGVPVKK